MATKKLTSLKGRVIRLTRLDDCGVPVVGACSTIVSAGFISVEFTPNIESGEEYTQKNAWGDFCIQEKDRDRWKWVDTAISLCEVDPDILDLVGGGTSLLNAETSPDTIGSSFGENGSLEAFALEVWTKQAGTACVGGDPEWGYFVAPFNTNGAMDGSVNIENGTMTVSLKGEAQKAPSDWGTGPYSDNPLLASAGFPTGDFFAIVRTTVQPPAVTAGCVALA